jgi:hypothetical protein
VNDENENRPVLDDVTPVQWDPRAEVSYELAIEEISQEIRGLSALIFEEREKRHPDQHRIDTLLKQQKFWSSESVSLRLGDAARPAETHRERDLVRPDDGLSPA